MMNSTLPTAFLDPVLSHLEGLDSLVHSSFGDFHPQALFESYYRTMCSQYSAFEIITLGSFLVQVVLYFSFSIPSFVFQFLPFMNNFKCQPNKWNSLAEQWICIKKVAWAKVSIYLPLSILMYYVLTGLHLILPYDYDSMPTVWELLPKLYVALMMEDCWHYWAHRALHHKAVYGIIHKLHHKYNVPFALAAEYAHPIETLALGVGFFIPMVFFLNHLFFFWAWLLVRMLQTTEVHCGYDFPYLNPLHFLPFYGGAPFHDYHHEKFTANYASTFTYWDYICGTDTGYAARLAGTDRKPAAKTL